MEMPTESSIRSLTGFLKSLINNIDDVLDDNKTVANQSNNISIEDMHQIQDICSINCEPAAFEEVANEENSVQLSTSISKCGIWNSCSDISEQLDYESNLDRLLKLASCFQCETSSDHNELISSDISPANQNSDLNFSNISCDFEDVTTVTTPSLKPFHLINDSPFQLFNFSHLDQSTIYTNFFSSSKRSAVYYGEYPYKYGGTHHPPKPFSDNKYLQKILSYLEVVMPGIPFNSAMIHKYDSGDAYIPHHADDEEEIMENSEIITISLGESRFIEFRNASTGSMICQKLNHGDVFVMNKCTQGLYTHSITKDHSSSLGPRLSITVRMIKPQALERAASPVSPEPLMSSLSTIANFLHDVGQGADMPEVIPPFEPTTNISHVEPLQPDTPQITPQLQQAKKPTSLYISSSMFRFLDTKRLSSRSQDAEKLFYPGADASQMLNRLKTDPKFLSLEKGAVTKIFLLTGTNNIDSIYFGDSFDKSARDISNLISFIQDTFSSAIIHVINILPRKTHGRMDIINLLNDHIISLCNQSVNLSFVDTYSNYMFAHREGCQRKEFFKPGGQIYPDDCHLNAKGVVRLGKHLKFVAHQQ